MLFRKQLILAKIESNYGVDPTPTAAANSILCGDLTVSVFQGDTYERNVVRPDLGLDKMFHLVPLTTVSFSVELAGANGAQADTAPAWDCLLKACGFAGAAAITPTRYEYTLDDTPASVTIWYYTEKTLHKLSGARGNVRFTLGSKAIPTMTFTFTGIPGTMVDTDIATDESFAGFTTPVPVLNGNTTFSLHSYSANMESWELDMGNDVQYRNLIGTAQVIIADRAPTGQIVIEETEIATKDWWTIISGHTTGALAIVHGTVAKNKVQFTAPAVQLVQPTWADSQGQRMLQMTGRYIPSAGSDEIVVATL